MGGDKFNKQGRHPALSDDRTNISPCSLMKDPFPKPYERRCPSRWLAPLCLWYRFAPYHS